MIYKFGYTELAKVPLLYGADDTFAFVAISLRVEFMVIAFTDNAFTPSYLLS